MGSPDAHSGAKLMAFALRADACLSAIEPVCRGVRTPLLL